MSADTKKWINRGGLGLMIIGAILIIVGGGDVEAGFQFARTAVTIAGSVLVLIRELLG